MTEPLRVRILTAANQLTMTEGWSAVTMARLGEMAGVSRQSVYNQFGSKPKLAQAMVSHESERFLAAVAEELRGADDLVSAIRAACERVLTMAEQDAMLRAVVSAGPDGNSDLLPFLTTQSQPILHAATSAISAILLDRFADEIPDDGEFAVAVDAVVRLVLSHVTLPGGTPVEVADEIAMLTARLIRNGA